MVPGFPHTGAWTDALTGDVYDVTDLGASFYFGPGQYHLWLDTPVDPVSADEPLPLSVACNDAAALNFGLEETCSYELVLLLDATDLAESGDVSPQGLHVAGSFQGWNPSGTPLVELGENLWQAAVVADAGSVLEYKFINGNTWGQSELVPSGCGAEDGFGGYNRQLLVMGPASGGGVVCFGACAACLSNLDFPGCLDSTAVNFDSAANTDDGSCLYEVVLRVDVSEVEPLPSTVYVAGSFQGWDASGTPMNQVEELWTVSLDLPAFDTVEYKFLAGPEWALEEVVPEACGVPNGLGGYNRALLPADTSDAAVVCFGQCGPCSGVVNPPVDGAEFCGTGTVWDPVLEWCVGITTCSEDIDGDGLIGVADVLALLSAFGNLCP